MKKTLRNHIVGSMTSDNIPENAILVDINDFFNYHPSFVGYKFHDLGEFAQYYAKQTWVDKRVMATLQPIVWKLNEILFRLAGTVIFNFHQSQNKKFEEFTVSFLYEGFTENLKAKDFLKDFLKELDDSIPFTVLIEAILRQIQPTLNDNDYAMPLIDFITKMVLYSSMSMLESYISANHDFGKWCDEKNAIFLMTGELWMMTE